MMDSHKPYLDFGFGHLGCSTKTIKLQKTKNRWIIKTKLNVWMCGFQNIEPVKHSTQILGILIIRLKPQNATIENVGIQYIDLHLLENIKQMCHYRDGDEYCTSGLFSDEGFVFITVLLILVLHASFGSREVIN